MRLFKNANYPFVQKRFIAYGISIALLIVAVAGLIINGLNLSTDFTGGVTATVNMTPQDKGVQPLHIDKLRQVVNSNGFKDAEIQYIGDKTDANFQIKVKGKDQKKIEEQLITILTTNLSDYTKGRNIQNGVLKDVSAVGERAGAEMARSAFWAVLIALILMIIYIWVRFEFFFGLMGIIALAHDVLLVVGVFAITGKEISMSIIAALLTIVGYSINDTIVIYDRIREDLKVYRKDSIPVVFNRAINKTLSRTILTGGTTLFTAIALYFFGGSVIHDFALAMTLGIIFGTYSSIFVASNLVIDTYHFSHQEKQSIKHLTKK